MITYDEAREIGIEACINRLGREFVLRHRDTSTSAYSVKPENGMVFCYVGVDDRPQKPVDLKRIVLDSITRFPHYASCYVDMRTGEVLNLNGLEMNGGAGKINPLHSPLLEENGRDFRIC